MTRKELLSALANDVVEVALSKGVCLGEAECLIVREAVLVELVGVEREVWEKVIAAYGRYRESLIPKPGCEKFPMPLIQTFHEWLVAQQQELGS